MALSVPLVLVAGIAFGALVRGLPAEGAWILISVLILGLVVPGLGAEPPDLLLVDRTLALVVAALSGVWLGHGPAPDPRARARGFRDGDIG